MPKQQRQARSAEHEQLAQEAVEWFRSGRESLEKELQRRFAMASPGLPTAEELLATMPRGFDGHRDHLMRGSELPAAAFQGGGALEMLCYLSLQGLPRHSRVYCNLHLDGGWHDSLELRCVHTAIAEKEPGLLKGHAGPSQSLVEADRDEHDEMNLEHAIDANQLQLEEDDAPAKERAKIVSKAAVTEGEGLSLLQQAAQGSNVVAASAGNTDGDRRHARFEDRSDGSNGDTRGARAWPDPARRVAQNPGRDDGCYAQRAQVGKAVKEESPESNLGGARG